MNRRGIIFLFAGILLAAIMLTIMFTRTLPTERERSESSLARVATMDGFLKDFHADIERATFISGFRALIAVEERISQQGAYIQNVSPLFVEAFMNGTVAGQAYEVMANSTFNDYLTRVRAEAAIIGIDLNASVSSISLSQSTPWALDVTFEMNVSVVDMRGLASWEYLRNFSTEVSILNLRDPVFSVGTLGKVPNTVRISPFENEDFVVAGNDTTNLDNETREMYYRRDPHAPSFLQRISGNLSASSEFGISALVDLDELNNQGLFVATDRSVLDYLYFNNASTTNYCPDFGSPLAAWFKIDQAHFNDPAHNFELDDLNATVC